MHDAIIVGGSYAGLSGALQLARARRKILVIDKGERRNRFAHAAHGFLGQDGRPPGDIIADARAQLAAYPSVAFLDAEAETAEKHQYSFIVTAGGERYPARRLLLATGVVDTLPEVEGLAERWGDSVFHCPYCHGYELGEGPIGVLASSEQSMHHALMLPDWGETTLFLNGAFAPDEAQRNQLQRRGVRVEDSPVLRISGHCDIELADGRTVSLAGIATLTRTAMASPLAAQLGCVFEDGPVGPYIRTNEAKGTSVDGVFAAGDAARPSGSVALAVGEGALAGVAVHASLMFGE